MAKKDKDLKSCAQTFEKNVFPDEIKSVTARWREVYGEAGPRGIQDATSPTTDNGLVGLAFSGGGIRSATINLGIAQSLHRHGVFEHVDYLSTVSGGGYIGSSLSTIMRDGASFPYEHSDGPKESTYLTWLRNHSNYLAERGLLDYLRIFAVLMRGILINVLLVLLPFLMVLSLILDRWFGGSLEILNSGVLRLWSGQLDAGESISWTQAFRVTPIVFGLAIFYTMAYPIVIRVFKVLKSEVSAETGNESSVKSRNAYELTFAALVLTIGAVAAIELLPLLLHWFHAVKEGHGLHRGLAASVAGGSSVVALTVVGRLMTLFKGLTRTLIMLAVGLLGLVLPLLIVLYVAEGLVYDWPNVGWATWTEAGSLGAWVASNWIWIIPGILLWFLLGGYVASAFSLVLAWVDKRKRARGTELNWVVRSLFLGLAGITGVVATIWAIAKVANLLPAGGIDPFWFVAALTLLIAFLSYWSVDVNLTAVLGMYRDRLASSYLVGINTDDVVDIEEDLDLHAICQTREEVSEKRRQEICEKETGQRHRGSVPQGDPNRHLCLKRQGSIAPYHLVNTSLNLQGSKAPDVRERNADFFTFSKKWVGGPRTGYCNSLQLEAVFPQMDLATAMGISAAAASPNMGKGTSPPLVAILTLFNVRLGYWVPNPGPLCRWARDKKLKDPLVRQGLRARFRWRVLPWYFLKEMGGKLDETSDLVNLSDGGHLENTAAYELLRRRCEFIIAGDGEADKDLQFNGLAELKRYAFIDMGIEIEILLDDLRLGPDGTSNQHCAIGKIHYPPAGDSKTGETGYLLYIKSSFTGDEDEIMRQYRAKSGDFPHESTADQFFSEGQFEAYRALGYHMTEGLFDFAPDLYRVLANGQGEHTLWPIDRAVPEGWGEEGTTGNRTQALQRIEEVWTDLAAETTASEKAQQIEKDLDQSEPIRPRRLDYREFVQWFDDLQSNLAPRLAAENLFLELQSDLGEIEDLLQRKGTERLARELQSVVADRDDPQAGRPTAEDEQAALFVVTRMMRLMENVFTALDLERPKNRNSPGNEGWMTLFRTWAGAPLFQHAYGLLNKFHTHRFREFCGKALGLK